VEGVFDHIIGARVVDAVERAGIKGLARQLTLDSADVHSFSSRVEGRGYNRILD
jgi:hypothetical protein